MTVVTLPRLAYLALGGTIASVDEGTTGSATAARAPSSRGSPLRTWSAVSRRSRTSRTSRPTSSGCSRRPRSGSTTSSARSTPHGRPSPPGRPAWSSRRAPTPSRRPRTCSTSAGTDPSRSSSPARCATHPPRERTAPRTCWPPSPWPPTGRRRPGRARRAQRRGPHCGVGPQDAHLLDGRLHLAGHRAGGPAHRGDAPLPDPRGPVPGAHPTGRAPPAGRPAPRHPRRRRPRPVRAGRARVPGAVIEGFGGGHVAGHTVDAVRALAARMPVVLASRTGAGETLTSTYGFPGGEIDLLRSGLVPAGRLDGLKARLLLATLLAQDAPRDRIHQEFARARGRGTPRRPAPPLTAPRPTPPPVPPRPLPTRTTPSLHPSARTAEPRGHP